MMPVYKHHIRIEHIFRSVGHNYFTHKRFEPGIFIDESLSEVSLEAGKGIANDRFELSRYPITFFSQEVADFISEEISSSIDVKIFRRNIIVSGVNLNELVGEDFQIGDITFRGIGLCHPCLWMNAMIHENVYKLMKGRGGLRSEVIVGGVLNQGENILITGKKIVLPALPVTESKKLP